MNELSDNDIIEIKSTWKIPMADPSGSGQAILLKFFERYPSNLLKFKDFAGRSLEELKVIIFSNVIIIKLSLCS